MFKKLKQKISEEQQQLQQALASTQPFSYVTWRRKWQATPVFLPGESHGRRSLASSSSSTPTRTRSRTSSFTESLDEGTPNRENASFQATKSPDRVNGSEPTTPQSSDTQSFAQKLQLRVPSVESLFRSPVKESLVRSSSKESLVRTSSRESLNRFDLDSSAAFFDPPSDMESETEDSLGNLDSLSKEQLIQWLRRMERRLNGYKGKCCELVTAYQTLHREKKKLQGILSQSQDKALRRIGELREELQMDQQAKKHLQEEFDASLEEKDQYISVLQTQVSLLKQRLRNGPMNADLPKPLPQMEPEPEGINKDNTDSDVEPVVGDGASAKAVEALQQRVKRQENLLQRCKETIRSHKEQCVQLTSEKEALQEQLDERLQELEKMKELHMAEKTKLITQLRDAKNLIEQLEQDKGMVIAETKRQMHETLEMKEEEIAQLRSRIKQMTTQGEELREQKEKSERAAFEELEKALSTAQKTEEARRKMKAEMDEQIKAIEKASEEERVRLQQELSCVKQEVVDVMKKSSEQIAKLQKLHEEELASKEQELTKKLQTQETEFQEQMRIALEKSQSEYLKITQEKDQQESLALEELELQKKAILTESENKLRDLQQEAETYRTRILELESSLEKSLQENKNQSEDLTIHLEAEKNKHNKEITIMVEKHKTELESLQHQQDNIWTEKLQVLKQQHQTEMEELREKYEQEKEILVKDRETLFQAHIEEMNEKTLEKLDVKQTELESLSSELSEVLKTRDKLEEELSVLKDQADRVKQELEAKLDEQKDHHQQQVDNIIKEQEISIQRTEKALKDEINQLGLLLKEKDRHLKEHQARVESLEADIKRSEGELQQASTKLELFQSLQNTTHEQAKVHEEQLAQLQQKLLDLETERILLTKQVAEVEAQKKDVCAELDTHKIQVQDLLQKLEKQNCEMEEKVKSLTQLYESQLKDNNTEQEQTKQLLMEKENVILQMREAQSKEIEILKQKLSAKEDSIRVLQEEYEAKFKNQEKKMEKIKQKAKEMQEILKKKLLDQEAKLKKELENTALELSQKEKQFNAKILEMAQANSAGINDAVSRLETNQKEQIESLTEAHRRELDDFIAVWERKLSQQAEELQEKHDIQLQEKEREVAELKQKMLLFGCEKEEMNKEMAWLKEEGARQDTALKELQGQLKQNAALVDSLTQNEAKLKAELEKLEVDLNGSLKENIFLQEQVAELKVLAEKDRLKVLEFTEKLKTTDEEFQSLKSLHDSSKKSLEDKSLEFKKLSEELAVQLDIYSKKTEALLQAKTSELIDISSSKISAILSRISHCQQHTAKVKEALLSKTCQVSELEAQLRQLTEEQNILNSSFQHAAHQLEEKESQIKSMKADIEGLVTEKEALQKEGGNQQQAASEKESCITQLKKELSENINAVTMMKEELKEKKAEISSLSKQLADLNAQLQNSISLAEKEAAISSLSKRHDEAQQELLDQVRDLSLKVETLSKEKTSALEQADHLSIKFSEWKKKAQSRFTQYQNTSKELQMQLELKTKETSEKDEQLTLLKEDLDQQKKRFEYLKSEMEDKKSEMEKRDFNLETELKTQTVRIVELEEHVAQKTIEIESLNEVLKNYHQQKDSEQKEMIQKLQHILELGEEKDNRVKEAEEKVLRLEEQASSMKSELESVKKELEHVNSIVKGKEEELKALEDRLELEGAAKLAELKKKAEQKIAAIKKQLLSQMEEKEQQYRKDKESHLSELTTKLQEKDREIHILEEKLKSAESSPQSETSVVPRLSENVAVCTEQEEADSQGCVQNACEEKLGVLQRNLIEKEMLVQRLEQEKEEIISSHSEIQCKYQELLIKIEQAEAKQHEDRVMINQLQEELEGKNKKHSLVSSQHLEEGDKNNTGAKQNLENVVDNVQKTLQGEDLTCQILEQKIKELDSCLLNEREGHRIEIEELTSKLESLQALQQQMNGKSKPTEVLEESAEGKSTSHVVQPSLLSNMEADHNDLEFKLAGAEQEKQKLSQEVVKLQKDIRMLRKEHQQELDIIKKEYEKEMEEKIKQEQEDLELKHNSTLKQLMREFHTQLAQKEQELEMTIKETIDKAQEVEAELLESHQEETNQLYKKIAEKEDDLKRTAKRYEEILDAREEEMTAKVMDLQTQFEDLQKKYQQRLEQEETPGSDKVTIMELQTQLAQKTTLISDSKLKEQEFREQIHNLEDRLKKYEKNVYATTVGTPYKGGNLYHTDVSLFGEPTEFEYLRKVLFEYMMGRETKTMAKVITTVLKFPDDQTQKILEREDARLMDSHFDSVLHDDLPVRIVSTLERTIQNQPIFLSTTFDCQTRTHFRRPCARFPREVNSRSGVAHEILDIMFDATIGDVLCLCFKHVCNCSLKHMSDGCLRIFVR
ncbi:golgin subfamily A member 4 isoform X5 [Bubalus bubalis]|uniref:golgin subfamily A member 4 isoform X5 n=1 Tax=Bubalus bubalis TaxID=89462 RepID=UPI001D0F8BC1|nr:golgin subfamily A member 4 isoform X5 [Bubalus bubalis]